MVPIILGKRNRQRTYRKAKETHSFALGWGSFTLNVESFGILSLCKLRFLIALQEQGVKHNGN